MSRSRAVLAAALLVLVVLVVIAPGTSVAGEPPLPARAGAMLDGDGDGVLDGLQRALDAAPGSPEDVIVVLRSQPSDAQLAAIAAKIEGLDVRRTFDLIPAFSARATQAQVEALTRLPEVERVEPNAIMRPSAGTGLDEFGVTKARTEVPGLDGNGDGNLGTYSKNDLVAAVLDTGIDTTHVALDGGKVIGWRDLVNNLTVPYDDNGHGTGVASILAGDGDPYPDRRYRGVAPGAALVGVKVTPADGVARMDLVIAGLEWVIANKSVYNIKIVNLSLGAVGCWDGTEAVSQAVNATVDAGLVVVVAAGNGGPEPCTIKSPGAAEKGLTVANIAALGSGGFYLHWTSSRGPTADGRMKPDIAGPGVLSPLALAGTTNEYAFWTGTSMASPFVAGVALLMLEQNPGLSPQQIKDAMRATAEDWGRGAAGTVPGSTGPDYEYGAGRLDAYAALKAVGAPLTSGPAVPTHVHWEASLGATGTSATYALDVLATSAPIAATLLIPYGSWSKDFDLELIDPSGSVVAVGANAWADRQEDVSFVPNSIGTYTLRVFSKAGAGDFYVDASAPTSTAPQPAAPTLSTSLSTVATGGSVTITWSGVLSPTTTDWIGLYRRGASDTSITKWVFTSSCTQTAGATAKDSGSCTMTMPTTTGDYELRLFANNGYTKLATSGVVTVGAAPVAAPTLIVSSSTVKVGQSVTVAWSGVVSPTGTDWIGLYQQGAAEGATIKWVFTSTCTQKSGTAKASGSCSMMMPKTAGIYEFRLFANNGYTKLATSPAVTVKK